MQLCRLLCLRVSQLSLRLGPGLWSHLKAHLGPDLHPRSLVAVGSSSRALSQRPPSVACLHGPLTSGFIKPAGQESARSGILSPLSCPPGWKQATGQDTFKATNRSGSLTVSRGAACQTPPPATSTVSFARVAVLMSVAPAPETFQALSGN